MKYSKVLFIVPSTSRRKRLTWKEAFSTPHSGILSIASILRMHGYEVNVIDLLVEDYSPSQFIDTITCLKPDVVGITTYTECYKEVLEISRVVKNELQDTKIVLGGAHITYVPEETLHNSFIDFLVMYEGEFTFLELMEYLNCGPIRNLSQIEGLAYRQESGIVKANPKRKPVEALDALPFPARDLIRADQYTVPLSLVSSRGCLGDCLFCLSPGFFGRKYRAMSAERLFSEIYALCRRNGERFFALLDDSFTFDSGRVEKFCHLLVESGLELYWFCYSRPEALSRRLLDKMSEAGCKAIQIGVESGDEGVLRSINKSIPIDRVEKLARDAAEVGIILLVSLLVGHPGDTKETINKTIELGSFINKNYRTPVSYAAITPFPGTRLYTNRESLGVHIHADSWDDYMITRPLVSTRHLSIDDVRNILFELTGGSREDSLVSSPDDKIMEMLSSSNWANKTDKEEATDRAEF